MIILKYQIKSNSPEEQEFEVTKIREATSTTSTRTIVDDNGNLISARRAPEIDTETSIREGISAVSLPSRVPADVTILETQDINGIATSHVPEIDGRGRPADISAVLNNTMENGTRPGAVSLESLSHEDGAEPIPLPKTGNIVWADKS